MSTTTRDWRDVARLARQRFERATSSASRPASNKQEAPPENAPKNDNAFERPRRSSVNFEQLPKMDFQRQDARRASWAAPKQNPFAEASRVPPPPPPRKMQKQDDGSKENSGPANRKEDKPVDENQRPEHTENMHEIPASFRNSLPTPKDVKPLTPLQERTGNQANRFVVPPLSAKKPGSDDDAPKLQPKPFAALLKENSLSYYEMLEISENATEKEIMKAYRSWARCTHPDHNKCLTATEDFQALQHIHEVLKVPKTRLAYNCRQKIRRCAFGSRARQQAYV